MTLRLTDPETRPAADRMRAVMLVVGLAFLGFGCSFVYLPAGPIAVGIVLTAAALGLSLRR